MLLRLSLGVLPFVGSALAQAAAQFTDPDNGITFWGITDVVHNVTYGYVFPPLATSGPNPNEYIGTIVSPLVNQWNGFALSGSMIDSLLIAAWPNNGKIVFTTRYATPPLVPTHLRHLDISSRRHRSIAFSNRSALGISPYVPQYSLANLSSRPVPATASTPSRAHPATVNGTSTGDDVSTASKASGRATPVPASTTVSQRTDPFERTIQSLVDRGIAVPPPTSLQYMRQMCSEAVTNYKNAHVTLQKAATTHQKFATASSNGTHVSSVVNHLKLPPHQTLNGVPDVMGDERVVAALASSEKDIATARASATTLLTTVYAVQVEKAQGLVDVPHARRAPLSQRILPAFTDEFKAVRFEFTARLDKEAMVKEAKAHAVETARADAEMADANRPH
ncbi:Cellobiose dehydrogenase [Mycena venus]|uniref:Cellobiose dehydrogenase n=1 Tax=Mycena venus TaxID=2733690 RepID=A0A8H7DEC0_9AGAR|nr:Cellobiose dehydrogenase [Mycena venus]